MVTGFPGMRLPRALQLLLPACSRNPSRLIECARLAFLSGAATRLPNGLYCVEQSSNPETRLVVASMQMILAFSST